MLFFDFALVWAFLACCCIGHRKGRTAAELGRIGDRNADTMPLVRDDMYLLGVAMVPGVVKVAFLDCSFSCIFLLGLAEVEAEVENGVLVGGKLFRRHFRHQQTSGPIADNNIHLSHSMILAQSSMGEKLKRCVGLI